jgi:hypothetical protein
MAFWAALDSRALTSLHRVAASAAFLSSLLECIIFLIKRMRNDDARSSETDTSDSQGTSVSVQNNAVSLVKEQFARIWEALTSKKLKVEERAAARLLAQTLEGLYAVDQSLLDAAWDVLAKDVKSSATKDDHASLVSAVLKVFYDRFKKEDSLLKANAETLMNEVLHGVLEQCEQALNEKVRAEGEQGSGFALLASMLDRFREGLFADRDFANVSSCHWFFLNRTLLMP